MKLRLSKSFAMSLAAIGVAAMVLCRFEFSTVAGSSGTVQTNSTSGAVITSEPPHLHQLLNSSETTLDLALITWQVASELPEFADFTREEYFQRLDALTEQTRRHMMRMESVAISRGEDPKSPKTRCALFCNAMIKLGFAYSEEFRREMITPQVMKVLYADASHITLAGLLRTQRGSCVSMPLIYLVIGQRLGMPVHLVALGKHYFIRWEEPGFRMNIETTIVDRVSVTPDDSVYLEIEGMTREQLRGSDLRNLTSREVVGNLLFVRSAYWATKGKDHIQRQCRDLNLARQFAPDDHGIRETATAVHRQCHFQPDPTSLTKPPKGTSL